MVRSTPVQGACHGRFATVSQAFCVRFRTFPRPFHVRFTTVSWSVSRLFHDHFMVGFKVPLTFVYGRFSRPVYVRFTTVSWSVSRPSEPATVMYFEAFHVTFGHRRVSYAIVGYRVYGIDVSPAPWLRQQQLKRRYFCSQYLSRSTVYIVDLARACSTRCIFPGTS